MNNKFQNKYRISSHRKQGWDYSSNAEYFITLVVQNRQCYLGNISDNQMILSAWGEIIRAEWLKSFELRSELFCDEYVVMPNHLHAIVVIRKDRVVNDVETHGRASEKIIYPIVETHDRASLPIDPTRHNIDKSSSFVRKPRSLSSFISGFKSAVNSKIDDDIDKRGLKISKYNKYNQFFQANYHDHIIRNDEEYSRIKQYMINNPGKWVEDSLSK